jgi:putative xylitol transport system ATP-binding protein
VGPVPEVEGFRKPCGGVNAIRDARFALEAGAVDVACGGEGAWEFTYLAVHTRVTRRDAGKIRRSGRKVERRGSAEARASGLAVIEQESSPPPQLAAAENVLPGCEPLGQFGGLTFARSS